MKIVLRDLKKKIVFELYTFFPLFVFDWKLLLSKEVVTFYVFFIYLIYSLVFNGIFFIIHKPINSYAFLFIVEKVSQFKMQVNCSIVIHNFIYLQIRLLCIKYMKLYVIKKFKL